MATKQCPYADLSLTFPDEWRVGHYEKWAKGNREAVEAFGKDVSVGTMQLFGSIALCKKIEGSLTEQPLTEWPLAVYHWIVDTVYRDSFRPALHPEKNSSSPAPTTPKDS